MKPINLIFIISMFFFAVNYTFAQNTFIPDNNFEQALIDLGYDSGPLNDSVPTANIDTIKTLVVTHRYISELTGLESFKEIRFFNCSNNLIANIDLSQNSKLEYLDCSKNQISTIDLKFNSQLTDFYGIENNLIDIDFTQNELLEVISLSKNDLYTIDCSSNINLKKLTCNYCPNLTNINLKNGQNNYITYFQAKNNPNLTCVQVDDARNSVGSGNWFIDNNVIYAEDCGNIPMTYIPDDNFEQALYDLGYDNFLLDNYVPTIKIFNIKILDIANKNISELAGIEDFEYLEQLYCNSNKIADLDISHNQHLTYLNASNNLLTGLNLKNGNNQQMTINVQKNADLFCVEVDNPEEAYNYSDWLKNPYTGYSDNCSNYVMQMTYIPDDNFEQALNDKGLDFGVINDSVPTLSLKYLKTLNIGFKNITDLTGIEDCEILENLYCNSNQLKELNLTGNSNLKKLDCSFNEIEILDFSNNMLITNINCGYNKIVTLDLSNLTYLTNLDAYNNQLSDLNVKNGNNPNMTLNVGNNVDLLCIQVDNAEASYNYNSWIKIPYTGYSENCSSFIPHMTYVPDNNFENYLINIGCDFGSLNDSVPTHALNYLNKIYVGGERISDLTGLEQCKRLIILECYSNPYLKKIDLRNCPELDYLNCNFCDLTELDVSSNNKLVFLDCRYNKISALHVGSNEVLRNIYCSDNVLESIDISQNPSVAFLNCSNNNLSSLDLKNGYNSNLWDIDVRNNPNLLCIQVDDSLYAENNTRWLRDEQTEYHENCNFLTELTYVPDDNFEKALIDFGYDSGEPDNFVNTNTIRTIKHLDISSKNIYDLTGLQDFESLESFNCSGNRLVFSDFKFVFELPFFNNFETDLIYRPQALLTDSVYFDGNGTIELDIENRFLSEGDNYRWFKDGVELVGETNNTIIIRDPKFSDSGAYRYEITNLLDASLILSSGKFNIKIISRGAGVPIEEYLALEKFYNNCDGINWRLNNAWLDTINWKVDDWQGIKVENGHVTHINLYQNYIKGILPEELQNLSELNTIVLYNNQLEGQLPGWLGNLSKLEWLQLNGNNFTGSIPTELGNCNLLESLQLKLNNLTGPIPETISNLTRLRSLLLSFNNLKGNVPKGISNLVNLENIDISNNELEGFIPLTTDQFLNLDRINISKNNFIFKDFIHIASGFNKSFYYYPQAILGDSIHIQKNIDETVSFLIDENYISQGDRIQWFKNNLEIEGEKDSVLYISNVVLGDSGIYHYEITNPVASELILKSANFRLSINSFKGTGTPFSEYKALVDLYNNFNGVQWLNHQNWLDTIAHSVNDWQGITVENGNVISIDLSGLNLEGDISSYFADFDSLKWLNLANNKFSGKLSALFGKEGLRKSLLTENSSLEYLNIANNQFTFADLEPNASELNSIGEFIYAPQAMIGMKKDTSIYKYEDITLEFPAYISAPNDYYTWLKDGSVLGESNLPAFVIENAALNDSGSYTLSVTNLLFPELTLKSDTITLKVLTPVKNRDISLSGIKLYPNPADDKIFIDLNNRETALTIYNYAGIRVYHEKDCQSGWLDVKAYSPGVYIFRFENAAAGTINRKVVIE